MTTNNIKETDERIEQFSMSFQEIGNNLGISENEVKKLYNVAIRKLKHPKYYKYFKELINMDESINDTLEKYGENHLKDK